MASYLGHGGLAAYTVLLWVLLISIDSIHMSHVKYILFVQEDGRH